MRKQFRLILIEFLWIIISLLSTLLIIGFIFGSISLEDTLDVHLYDTYFVFSQATIGIPLFLLLTLFIFCVKEARQRFSRAVPNIIIFLSGLLLIVFLTNFGQNLIRVGIINFGGWTAYPPLSALQDSYTGEPQSNSLIDMASNALTVFQLFVTLTLLYISFRWGTQRKYNK